MSNKDVIRKNIDISPQTDREVTFLQEEWDAASCAETVRTAIHASAALTRLIKRGTPIEELQRDLPALFGPAFYNKILRKTDGPTPKT